MSTTRGPPGPFFVNRSTPNSADVLRRQIATDLRRQQQPEKAPALLKKLEFHDTPKHGSWLNMAEIEFSALSRQCLSQRTPDIETLKKQVDASQTRRNQAQTRIPWQFTTSKARETMARCYPAQSTA